MSTSSKQILLGGSIALAALALFVGAIVGARAVIAKNQSEATAVQDDMIERAKVSVRSRLKDPASAVFSELRILGNERVCGYVNAKNSFGGYTGNTRFVSFYGAVTYIGDEKPAEAMWPRPEHPCDMF